VTDANAGAPGGRRGAGRTPDPADGSGRTATAAAASGDVAEDAVGPASGGVGGRAGQDSRDWATDALERELSVLFRRARAASGELARAVHPELEPAAYGLLVRLAEAEPERATDLAGYFGVGKATMSRQLRAMEDLGLVTREPDPADGRAFLMRLTEEGRARFTRVRTARRERYVRQLAAWDYAEIAELSRLLNELNALQFGDNTQ
jgi:DNA-binding MarR family transcriptional regulator